MSNHKLIEAVTKSQLRTDLPTFRTGDTLRVHVRIVEGSRTYPSFRRCCN